MKKRKRFGLQVQKQFCSPLISKMPYIQRFVLETEYACAQGLDFIDYKNPLDNFSHIERDLFKDSIAISAHFTSSVIVGMLVTQLKIDLGTTFRYHIQDRKPGWSLLLRFH